MLAWQAENRASFILDKLAEGYGNAELEDQLGFSLGDIQAARQTRAVADMARSLDLPEEVKAKLDNPRAKLFTTLERVFDSTVGRKYLMVEPDAEHGIRGKTTKAEFVRVFKKLVCNVALGNASSRTLNKNEDIESYFRSWPKGDRASGKNGVFVPDDLISGESVASSGRSTPQAPLPKPRALGSTVIPRDLKIRFGNDRLKDIRNELVRLKREKFPNAGAVMLRVFFELSAIDYLERTGELPKIIARIEAKEGRALPFGIPTLRQLTPEITAVAKAKLKANEARMVEKAIRHDASAPFTISELHGFVHQTDFPSARDILQFWKRTEPIIRLMLEQDPGPENE